LLADDVLPNDNDACVRLGLTLRLNPDISQFAPGKVYDGSSFDFGFQKCENKGRYPWCPRFPACDIWPAGTSIVMNPTECWYNRADEVKCAALCKKKLE
ncbi:hypothetical protein AAVH_25038, partial [Aphelenchoides avenae]